MSPRSDENLEEPEQNKNKSLMQVRPLISIFNKSLHDEESHKFRIKNNKTHTSMSNRLNIRDEWLMNSFANSNDHSLQKAKNIVFSKRGGSMKPSTALSRAAKATKLICS